VHDISTLYIEDNLNNVQDNLNNVQRQVPEGGAGNVLQPWGSLAGLHEW